MIGLLQRQIDDVTRKLADVSANKPTSDRRRKKATRVAARPK